MSSAHESDPQFHIILSYFNGKYWEGGAYDGATARQLYGFACKNGKVYRSQLLSYTPGSGWSTVAQNTKPIPPDWYRQRGMEAAHDGE